MWMDWNDPEELRRLRDLLAVDPARGHDDPGPRRPVTDTVEMLVGRLGMPDTGGSYFTFSNENNDLIWGFLAECHRRGWLYKGHDTMPWCARCGTGLSQMEMNEGYQDREDPGLTVRFPLLDRPGRGAPRLDDDALDADLERGGGGRTRAALREGPPGRRPLLARPGDAQAGPERVASRCSRSGSGSELVGWRYAGPFDDLPVVREAFAKGTRDAPDVPYEHRVIAWTEVGEEEGTGIVHIAPGCGAEDFALGRDARPAGRRPARRERDRRRRASGR